ncbi:hypothetical protein X751_27675 [Mesorhizobium sp. LNJC395A00]|nr:hypothetical protein X751_27675 [Mesorhizobium sp. LNJC395A00]
MSSPGNSFFDRSSRTSSSTSSSSSALGRRTDADDFQFLADLDDAALDAAGDDRATARDREHVFNRHQERLVQRTNRRRDVSIDRSHQLADRIFADGLVGIFECCQRRTLDDRNVVAGELVLRQKLANLELDQFEQLGIVDLVDLVQEHHDRRHADLTGKQDVLAGLRHRAVGGRHHQDRAVHLRGAGDHVLHIVGVAGAVDMGVVARCRLVFDVRRRNGDAAGLLFGRRIDLVVALVFAKILRDRRRQRRLAMIDVANRANVHMRLVTLRRQRRLAMIDVANRANVHMRLVTLEFTFCHVMSPICSPVRALN